MTDVYPIFDRNLVAFVEKKPYLCSANYPISIVNCQIMKHSIPFVLLSAMAVLSAQASTGIRPDGQTLLDQGWRFQLSAPDDASSLTFDDASWRLLDLPHDWSIEGVAAPDNAMGNDGGYFPDGYGWYRRHLTVGPLADGEELWLYFEGAYMQTEVWVNGQRAGQHAYGYTSFRVDLTPYLVEGDNVLAVRVDDTMQKNCRWYSGSGLFRHVWLQPRHRGVMDDPWQLRVRTEQVYGMSADGLHADSALLQINYGTDYEEHRTLRDVSLWCPQQPALIQLRVGALTLDYGVRTLSYTAERGFELNGQPMAVFGGCIHHDNGILGAAAYDRAEERKVLLMKQAGFNCVRTSHNPTSEEFLGACDRLGLMVIDEAFDGWRTAKNDHDYHELLDSCWQEDIRAMVLRDRCHPSIISWSVGNEVIERKQLEVVTTAHKLANLCRELDGTRPVTEALAAWDSDWEIYDPLAAQHEVIGYNYLIHKAEADHERVPDRIIWQTESYPRDAFQSWVAVHDHPYIIGDFVWTAIDYQGEAGIGRYYYEGETPGEHYQGLHFPWHGAYCGDIDLTGWRKPISYYRQLLFDPEHAEPLHMAVKEPDGYRGKIRETLWSVWPTWDSWNWPGWEGRPIEVEVYSKFPVVRLYLNDRLVGEQQVSRATQFKAVFTVPYEAGVLRAEGVAAAGDQTRSLTETQAVSTTSATTGTTASAIAGTSVSLSTAGEPYALRLTPTTRQLQADGEDLSYITVEVVDRQGRVCPDAEVKLEGKVKGCARLAALGNANLQDLDAYTDDTHLTWKGRALLVIRSGHKRGSWTVSLRADGLKAASLSGTVR